MSEIRPLTLKNTLSGEKELFKPITPGRVGMYLCGPTVYGEPHLGHARSAIDCDVVYRYLLHLGYRVRFVRNITDVGHLEDEVNEQGEDKISKKARLEQLEPMEVAQHYTNIYRAAMADLNTLTPSIEPRASGHIIEQISAVEAILERGLAYEVNGSVYFDVPAYAKQYPYGELSGRKLDELLAGSRELQSQDEKRNQTDFALWKKADESHIMQWPSPWGQGFPGWHMECTAMSGKYLGVPFDIHMGGMDLKFPHHEAEIAQCKSAHDKAPVNYWLHNNMVTLDGQKMAKSKGNFITLAEMFSGNHKLLEQAYSPQVVRFFMLQSHYSSTMDFSNTALQAAEKALERLRTAWQAFQDFDANACTGSEDSERSRHLLELCEKCYDRMSDDFNTAETLGVLFEMASIANALLNGQEASDQISPASFAQMKEHYRAFAVDVLGIELEASAGQGDDRSEALLDLFAELRQEARAEKNWALSDAIRDRLAELGFDVKDTKL
jgi:cysteinyl-tRNA synthetase